MNIRQANNLDFRDLLSKLGHEPSKVLKGGRDIWYCSPFRKEKEPSFHIREGREYDWIWYDFGHDGASTILDFIMQYQSTDKRGALAFLDTLYPNYKNRRALGEGHNSNQVSFLFPSQSSTQEGHLKNKVERHRDFQLVRVLPIKSEAVFSYLESRCIPRRIASKYFRLVQYSHKERPSQKPYFGFGVQNESGGWEVRSASDNPKEIFKTAISAKDITIIRGGQGSDEVSVFEGMMDFVSLLAMYGKEQLNGDAIILHGLKLYGRAAKIIQKNGYKRVHTFLDNNTSGQEATLKFISDFGHSVENHSDSFLPYVDLNDALRGGFNPTFHITSKPIPPNP